MKKVKDWFNGQAADFYNGGIRKKASASILMGNYVKE
jgi:hypothetical protein